MVEEKLYKLSEVAGLVGISYKTIIRWEETDRIAKPKRNFRGWRMYTQAQVDEITAIKSELT